GRAMANGLLDVIRAATGGLGEMELDQLLKALATHPVLERRREALATLAGPSAGAALETEGVQRMLASLPLNPVRSGTAAVVGTVGVPVGYLSPAGSAMIGHDGHAFLLNG